MRRFRRAPDRAHGNCACVSRCRPEKSGCPGCSIPPRLFAWIERHRPLLSTTLFFRPEYGFDLLVEGIARLRGRYPALGCLVMGSGEQSVEASQRVRDAGLENDVLLLGDVDHDTCLALMRRSHVFVRATLEDGDSISVREALALGVPVVASRVGSRPPGAILFHPGDVEDMLSKVDMAWTESQADMSPTIEKLKRLTAMSPRELAHRAREKGYSQLERIGFTTNNPGAPDGAGFKQYLAGKPARALLLAALVRARDSSGRIFRTGSTEPSRKRRGFCGTKSGCSTSIRSSSAAKSTGTGIRLRAGPGSGSFGRLTIRRKIPAIAIPRSFTS
jgi:hypothetical protein